MNGNPTIYIAGVPGAVGGANTECLHTIYLLREHGVDVHLVACNSMGTPYREELEKLGVFFHPFNFTIFKDKIVTSWCNGYFLRLLPKIHKYGKPKCVIWHNTMTWHFNKEVNANRRRLITYHGFVSEYQKKKLKPVVEEMSGVPVKDFEGYMPYYRYDPSEFKIERPTNEFCIGRVSRADPTKFAKDTWKMFSDVQVPSGVKKKVIILGWSGKDTIDNPDKFDTTVEHKIGPPPDDLDVELLPPGAVPVKDVYHRLHCIMHKTDTSGESYCRIVPECYAHGTVMIAENNFAFPTLIRHNVDGFLANTTEEMSEFATAMAFEPNIRIGAINSANRYLKDEMANSEKCFAAWKKVLNDFK